MPFQKKGRILHLTWVEISLWALAGERLSIGRSIYVHFYWKNKMLELKILILHRKQLQYATTIIK